MNKNFISLIQRLAASKGLEVEVDKDLFVFRKENWSKKISMKAWRRLFRSAGDN